MSIIFFSHLFLACLLYSFIGILAQRNAKEEAICAPFLTSAKSSPLISHLERNLTIDEDAEFACELVLQDRYLPAQIRVTIHEGLYYLALRHMALGISREYDAYRHVKTLSDILPKVHKFNYAAGTLAMHPLISKPQEAIKYLKNCLYGNASSDASITQDQKYISQRYYIKALGSERRFNEAIIELYRFIRTFPLDFEAEYLLESNLNKLIKTEEIDEEIFQTAYASILLYLDESISKTIKSNIVNIANEQSSSWNAYLGASDYPNNWQPQKLNHFPSLHEFQYFADRKEPFIISLGSIAKIEEVLNWNVKKWFQSKEYLNKKLQDVTVYVESIPLQTNDTDVNIEGFSSSATSRKDKDLFGLGLSNRRSLVSFAEIYQKDFIDSTSSYYLNIQPPTSGQSYYRPPLDSLQEDLPIPNSSDSPDSVLEFIAGNLTQIHLWMGRSSDSATPTTSRLHRDANDNFYIVFEGKKKFHLWHPSSFASMQTISPSYALNKDGLAYQFNINRFRDFLQSKANLTLSPLIQRILLSNVMYDLENIHFSTLSYPFSADESSEAPSPIAEVELEVGDIFFLPTGWFHQVSSFAGKHTAINIWWKPSHWKEAKDEEIHYERLLFEELFIRLNQTQTKN